MTRNLALIFFLFGNPSATADARQVSISPELARYTGYYTNIDFGFTVRIPSGFEGLGATRGAPNHGFCIRFSDDEGDQIFVSAAYDLVDTTSEEGDARKALLSQAYAGLGFRLLETRDRKVSLGGMRAEELWVRLERQKDGVLFIFLSIGARRTIDGEPIVYSFSLRCPEAHYAQRSKIFTRLVKSFRLLSRRD